MSPISVKTFLGPDYRVTPLDLNTFLRLHYPTPINLSITSKFPKFSDNILWVMQDGDGHIFLDKNNPDNADITLLLPNDAVSVYTKAKNSVVTLFRVAEATWVVFGDLVEIHES